MTRQAKKGIHSAPFHGASPHRRTPKNYALAAKSVGHLGNPAKIT